ncbi:MAG: HD domain-containing protein [Patescibacteria group bacterium]
MKKKSPKPLTNFFFELGMLKKIEHCGSKFAGVKHPDSLGEHTCRAAQIGYALAIEEGGDPEKVAAMCLMHDMGEIRVGDSHRIADRYFDVKPAEKEAVLEQTQPLPTHLRGDIRNMWKEFHDQKTRNSQIARDADLLETMFQAKEYVDTGYKSAARWLENGSKYLKTESAKKIFKEITKTAFSDWWDDLNKV